MFAYSYVLAQVVAGRCWVWLVEGQNAAQLGAHSTAQQANHQLYLAYCLLLQLALTRKGPKNRDRARKNDQQH